MAVLEFDELVAPALPFLAVFKKGQEFKKV